jgi:NhaP-type Na+/H+ or K+/H+ antiporter
MTELLNRILSATIESDHDIDDEHAEEHGDTNGGHHGVGLGRKYTFAFFISLVIGQLLKHFTDKIGIPFTPVVFVSGIILGTSRLISDERLNFFLNSLDPDFLLLLFLPPLVYESASSVDYHTFKRQSGKIFLMAFPMILCATYITAFVMYYVLGYQDTLPWAACVLFGAVISATDPVAVVSLLKQLGAPKSIATLIEGESLMNDGTAVVIFFVALDFLKGEELTIG